jgi:Tn3 transposase DDE domain
MIYGHVERKSVCIYSQPKTCSASVVTAMLEGLMRHDTNAETGGGEPFEVPRLPGLRSPAAASSRARGGAMAARTPSPHSPAAPTEALRSTTARCGDHDEDTTSSSFSRPATPRPVSQAMPSRYTTSPWRSVFSVTTRGSTKCSR